MPVFASIIAQPTASGLMRHLQLKKNREFIANSAALLNAGITAPLVLQYDMENGFLCVSDLGDRSLLSCLSDSSVTAWYTKALQLLPQLTQVQLDLPVFDAEFMERENAIFPEWLLEKHLQLELSAEEKKRYWLRLLPC